MGEAEDLATEASVGRGTSAFALVRVLAAAFEARAAAADYRPTGVQSECQGQIPGRGWRRTYPSVPPLH